MLGGNTHKIKVYYIHSIFYYYYYYYYYYYSIEEEKKTLQKAGNKKICTANKIFFASFSL